MGKGTSRRRAARGTTIIVAPPATPATPEAPEAPPVVAAPAAPETIPVVAVPPVVAAPEAPAPSAPAPVTSAAPSTAVEPAGAGPAPDGPEAPAGPEATLAPAPEALASVAASAPAGDRARAALAWWHTRLVKPVSALVGRMLGASDGGRTARPRFEPRRLPFELHLTNAAGAIRIAAAGPIDDLACFQRAEVSLHHDVEYLTRLDPGDAGSERYQAYGLFRLREREGQPLVDLRHHAPLWEALEADLGLRALPRARGLLRTTATGPGGTSWHRVVGGSRAFHTAHGPRVAHAEVLDWLRSELAAAEKIAWLEEAFDGPIAPGQVVHRYYVDARRQAWLVRHHWQRGKRLFVAQTSAEARRICEAESGAFARAAQRKAA